MMLYHGEDIVASRQALVEFRQTQVESGHEVVTLDGKKANLAQLRQATEALDLLGGSRAVIIEGLFAAPKSARVDELLGYLKTATGLNQVLLWENKKINANRFKPLKAEVKEFSLPKLLFTWLEGLAPNNPENNLKLYRQLLHNQPAELLMFMLARQLRQLLSAKFEPSSLTGPSWLMSKIKKQAEKFNQEQLLAWHQQLYTIDREIKTGQSLLLLNDRVAEMLVTL